MARGLQQSEKIVRQDEYARLFALHHPFLECCCAVLADVQVFGRGGVEGDEQAAVEPDSNIRHAIAAYQKLLVCPEKVVGAQFLGYLFQGLGIGIGMPVFQIDRRVAVVCLEERYVF